MVELAFAALKLPYDGSSLFAWSKERSKTVTCLSSEA